MFRKSAKSEKRIKRMKKPLDSRAKDLIFREARSHSRWANEDVSDQTLKEIVELMKWGATSANCWPMRLVFVKSAEAKARLKPHIDEFNVEKVLTAPVVAIIAEVISISLFLVGLVMCFVRYIYALLFLFLTLLGLRWCIKQAFNNLLNTL